MRKFAELVIRYRVFIIVFVVILTIFFGYSLKSIKINSDILSYLPQDDPIVVLFNEVGDKFGGNSLAMVAFETDNVFNSKTLRRINIVTQKFKEMPEVSHVMSLTDIIDIKKIEGGLEIGKLIDKYNIPEKGEDLLKVRNYTLSKKMYRGNIVSENGTVAVIIARIKEDTDKIAAAQIMKSIVNDTKGSEEIYFAGIPFQMISLTDIIIKDLKISIPFVILVVILTLSISMGSIIGVVLPLLTVIISTIWGLGLMNLLGVDVAIASAAIPVLLIAIGSAYGIHMVNKYIEDIQKGDNRIQGIKDALSEVGIPIILAGITTLIGFLAFLTSNLTLIKEFGVFTAFGVLFAMIVSITFLPAILSFLKPPKSGTKNKAIENTRFIRFMNQLGYFISNRKILIVVIAMFIIIAGVIAIPNLDREVNMIDYFKKDSDIRQAEDMMEKELGGSIPIQILIKGNLKNPFVLKAIVDFEKYLKTLPDVNNPQSVADLICEMNYVMNDYYTIPDSKNGVANLWFFLEGNDVLDQLINHDATEGLLQAKLGTINTRKMINTVDAINRHIDENIDTSLVHIQLTGLSSDFLKYIRENKVKRISKRIDCDAQEYNFKELNKTEIANILNKHIYTPFKYDNKGFKLVLSSRLNDYFSGGESDIEIKSIQDIKKIISEIVQLTSIGNPSEKQIIQLLHNCVPNRYYQDDPEILNYAAESISAIIKNEVEWQRVNSLVREIIPLFPKNLQNSRDFKKDLIGDVWEINETQMAAPYSDYVKYLKHVSINQQEKIKLDIKQTGMPIIFKDLDKNIIYSQFYSLTFAIILVFFLMIYQLKSIIRGLISLIPIILTILFNFTLMVLLNVPLDAVTVMVGSVAVGIGIDYTIHFNNRFHLEINRNNNEQEALNETLNTTGKSIIINAASVMMGFLVLIFGSIVPMQRFGWLISLTMLTSSISAITFLPAFILVSKVSFSWDLNHIIKDKQMKIKSKINNKVSSILIKKNKNGGKDVKN